MPPNLSVRPPKKRSREYVSWRSMIDRCTNPRSPNYVRYGGRGITVCPEWRASLAVFVADMGPRPEGTSLDRINNDGNYEPGNCRWATPKQQTNNARSNVFVEIGGERMTFAEASKRFGVPALRLRERVKKGWPSEMLLIPPQPRVRLKL